MADPKQQIEQECQQVQEHLLKLTADRNALHHEFEQLTRSSQRLLQQIQEDSTTAGERKFHNYEAEKKRIEEKLEALENDILEKNKKILLLDSKAGDYLLQVSTASNTLFDNEVAKSGISGDAVGSREVLACSQGGSSTSNEVVLSSVDKIEDNNVLCSKEAASDVIISKFCEQGKVEEPSQQVAEPPAGGCLISCSTTEEAAVEVQVEKEISVSEDEVKKEKLKEIDHSAKTVDVKEGDTSVKSSLEGNTEVVDSARENNGIPEDDDKGEDNMEAVNNSNEEVMNEVMYGGVGHSALHVAAAPSGLSVAATMQQAAAGAAVPAATPAPLSPSVATAASLQQSAAGAAIPIPAPLTPSVAVTVQQASADAAVPTAPPALLSLSVASAASLQQAAAGATAPTAAPSETSARGTPGADSTGKQTSGNGSPVRDQVASLSVLVAELRRVKDDMGKCMSIKEQSFIELEDQLQAANRELSALKVSMSAVSKDLEEKEQRYQALEEENKKKKMDIEFKMSEIQEVTTKCTMLAEEKTDLLRKLEVLEIMMTEYRTEIEMLIAEKTKMEEQTKELLAAKTTTSTAEAEIDSRTSVEEKEKEIEELVEKVQSMEKAMKELNDKLKVTNRHLKVMAREREHKQKECEVLRRKVEMVELKMCELQGTFDMLVKAVMVERDNVIKDMEDKTGQIDDLQQTLVRLKDTHEQELENVLYEKRLLDDELSRYRSGELRSSAVAVVEQRDFDVVTQEKQTLEIQVKQKTEETKILQDKVENIQHDMTEFVASLKDEMQRLKEDSEKVKAEKNDLTATFTTLHAEHLDLTNRHQQLEMSFQELEKSKREKTDNLESLRLQLEDLQHQLEDVSTKNIKTTAVMRTKEEEFREELAAREGTIQELTITLTNNQKQSMENYNALLDDKTALEIKYKNILTEKEKLKKDLDEKLTLLQEEKSQEVKELQEKIKSTMEELNKVKSELSEPVRAGEEQDKVASSQVNTDAPSHPPPTVGECGEVADREELIKVLTKRGQDLKEALESTHNKLDAKEEEIRTLVEEDIPKLRQTIKELTMELEALKQKSASAGTFESHEQFESVIAAKEEKIRELESKVGELDKCTAYITQLEGRLQETSAAPNTLESQLEQINQLSADISKLKEELQQSCKECEALKVTVTELQNENKNLQNEKSKLVEEYEKKLEEARNNVEEASSQLEEKKKLG